VVVFLAGANGFIGRHLLERLLLAGHEVVGTSRKPRLGRTGQPLLRWIPADFSRDWDPAVWRSRLLGVDVVINCVGILREHGAQTFEALHVRAPQALFSAAVGAGVRRIVQVSALGADEAAQSAYHRSKRSADQYLTTLPIQWIIVQPSLVYGPGGASARLFTRLASLPVIPLPGHGEQQVQPVHIDDVARAVLALLGREDEWHSRVPLLGPEPGSFRDFLGRLRNAMGLGPARFIDIPMPLVRWTAALGSALPGSLLDTPTLEMLLRGNTGDPAAIRRLLGEDPRPIEAFVPRDGRGPLGREAKLSWLLPPLRWSIAAVWILTGIVSLGVYPTSGSYELLRRSGVTGLLAPVFLYGAALLDLVLGFATLFMSRRRTLWTLQIALIIAYTAIITVKLPEFWIHPYGPIVKNLPLLAAIWLLREMES
jgi:uncharacterized protein YbjT (DUF2867 family)